MKWLFLDVDGVLNNWNECEYKADIETQLVPRCVNLLKEIINETNCYVVLSSSWRFLGTEFKNQFRKILHNDYGIKINYETPRLREGDRADEILQFLKDSPHYNNFVILDDEAFEFEKRAELKNHFVKTTGMFEQGLTQDNAEKAIKILNKEN